MIIFICVTARLSSNENNFNKYNMFKQTDEEREYLRETLVNLKSIKECVKIVSQKVNMNIYLGYDIFFCFLVRANEQ